MEKSETMKRYEAETGKQSAIVKFMAGGQALEQKSYPKLGPYDYSMDYIQWLEAKAAAYDRLMGGGKKTLKEWANIFGLPFAVGRNGQGIAFKCKNLPIAAGNNWWPTDVGDFGFAFIDSSFIDFNGDWKDSLTVPDGWEVSNAR